MLMMTLNILLRIFKLATNTIIYKPFVIINEL